MVRQQRISTLAFLAAYACGAPPARTHAVSGVADASVPRLVVSAWLTNDMLSRAAADDVVIALRARIPREELIVTSGTEVEHVLSGEWDSPPGPLSLTNVRDIGKLTRATAVIEVAAQCRQATVRLTGQVVRPRNSRVDTLPADSGLTLPAAAQRAAVYLLRDTTWRIP